MVAAGDIMGDSPARLWRWVLPVLGSVWGGRRGVAGLGLSCNPRVSPTRVYPRNALASPQQTRGGSVWV